MAAEVSPVNPRTEAVAVGIDVGSTTVKAVVVDPVTKEILWSDYLRHQTKQAEFVLSFLERIAVAFPNLANHQIRTFITGSGGAPIGPHLGSKFVQEVNAVTLAVETLHPDVGSVCELGGQDAKIIIFKKNEETGGKTAITSMNDKCASGTGATIDKCVIKVGLPNEEVVKIGFDDSKLHHVAAKCGVFAETDIVNLVKNGIPSLEIMNSLADAIVMQNLSVLTRGNTLRHKVLLLGGPNTYLPFLRDCWRKRIPELRKRFSHGLSFLASYTWSHSIDNVSSFNITDQLHRTPREKMISRRTPTISRPSADVQCSTPTIAWCLAISGAFRTYNIPAPGTDTFSGTGR